MNADQLIAALSRFSAEERALDVVMRDGDDFVHEIYDLVFNDGIELYEEVLPEHRPKVATTVVQLYIGDNQTIGCSRCGSQDFSTDNPSLPGFTQFVCVKCGTPVPERVA